MKSRGYEIFGTLTNAPKGHTLLHEEDALRLLFRWSVYNRKKTATHRGQEESVMKMIFAMLHSEDVDETVEELNKEKNTG